LGLVSIESGSILRSVANHFTGFKGYRLFRLESYRNGNWDIVGTAMYVSIGDVEEKSSSELSVYQLEQNYPNPFNSNTTIRYRIPKRSFVTIEIIDVLGRKVRTLALQERAAGTYKIYWGGKDDAGKPVGSGVYLCRLQAGTFVEVKRMVLLR